MSHKEIPRDEQSMAGIVTSEHWQCPRTLTALWSTIPLCGFHSQQFLMVQDGWWRCQPLCSSGSEVLKEVRWAKKGSPPRRSRHLFKTFQNPPVMSTSILLATLRYKGDTSVCMHTHHTHTHTLPAKAPPYKCTLYTLPPKIRIWLNT